jgi:AmiR/NasT family two-component response regulator
MDETTNVRIIRRARRRLMNVCGISEAVAATAIRMTAKARRMPVIELAQAILNGGDRCGAVVGISPRVAEG